MNTVLQSPADGYADILRIIETEVAAGASFPRILSALHAHISVNLFRSDKAAVMGVAERYGYSTVLQPHMGQMNHVRTDICSELHSTFLQHILASHIRPGLDAVFEIGCGMGHDLVGLAARYPTIPFVGGEIAPGAQAVVAKLAAAAKLSNVTAIGFDIKAPDFEFLTGKNVLVYSNFALVYASPFPRDFFPRLLDTVARAHMILFEPVSFELAAQMANPPLFTRERARGYGICEHLFAVIRELREQGRIILEEVVPDISGRSGFNAISLVRFKKAG
jgi:hypothetical protein